MCGPYEAVQCGDKRWEVQRRSTGDILFVFATEREALEMVTLCQQADETVRAIQESDDPRAWPIGPLVA